MAKDFSKKGEGSKLLEEAGSSSEEKRLNDVFANQQIFTRVVGTSFRVLKVTNNGSIRSIYATGSTNAGNVSGKANRFVRIFSGSSQFLRYLHGLRWSSRKTYTKFFKILKHDYSDIFEIVVKVWGSDGLDKKNVFTWFHSENKMFGGRQPYLYLSSEKGRREIIRVLTMILNSNYIA